MPTAQDLLIAKRQSSLQGKKTKNSGLGKSVAAEKAEKLRKTEAGVTGTSAATPRRRALVGATQPRRYKALYVFTKWRVGIFGDRAN